MNKLKKNQVSLRFWCWSGQKIIEMKTPYRILPAAWIFDVFRLLKIADFYKFISPFYQLNSMKDALWKKKKKDVYLCCERKQSRKKR